MTDLPDWSHPVTFAQAHAGLNLTLEPDESLRIAIARTFEVKAVEQLRASVRTYAVGDDVQIDLDVTAEFHQQCGVTLEPLTRTLSEQLSVRCTESAPPLTETGESELTESDLDAPDLVENGQIDLAGYVIEALALGHDPYARKPDADFVPPDNQPEPSPFAVLARLKGQSDAT